MRIVLAAVLFGLSPSAWGQCPASVELGTQLCPLFAAPVALPGPSLGDNSLTVGNASTFLFGGKVPPNGFSISMFTAANGQCYWNDNGPAGSNVGMPIPPGPFPGSFQPVSVFVTWPGYKPIGPVSVWCSYNATLFSRGW
jgi:hypothetical protein